MDRRRRNVRKLLHNLSIPLGELDFLGLIALDTILGVLKLSIPLGELDFLGRKASRPRPSSSSLSIPLGELDFLGLTEVLSLDVYTY